MRVSGSGGRPELFVDSSVLIAATLSFSGGSFRLCQESHLGRIRLQANRYVLEEVTEVLRRKYPEAGARFHALRAWAQVRVRPNPSAHLVAKYLSLIHPKDAPILAGAIAAHAAFLVTLDRKDFFTQRLAEASLPIAIVTPKEFFERHSEA